MASRGMHLIVNASSTEINLDDHIVWEKIFDKVVAHTQTNKIGSTNFHDFPIQGLTAFQVLSESHISVHTYPEKQSYYFDVYSCKEFEYSNIIKILKEELGEHKVDFHLMVR
jgi:S-adenosylmethionine decarboxylase